MLNLTLHRLLKSTFLTLIVITASSYQCAAQARLPGAEEQGERIFAQVINAIENNDLADAKKILQPIVARQPRSVIAHTLAGIIADKENDLPNAQKHFAAAARLAPQAPETRNNYGAILVRLNRKTEAAKEFSASLAANPNQASALINLAQIRFDENNLAAARQLFEKAKAIVSDSKIARALLVISLNLNEIERARQDFQAYFAASHSQTDQQARTEIGKLLLEHNLNAEAVQELETAFALDSLNADTLILLSQSYLARKDVKAAGKLLESAVSKGVDSAQVYAALAEVYKTGGFVENAIPAMRLAIEKDSKNEFYRARYGLLLIDTRAPAAAIIRLEEAVREFPQSARLWLALGIAQQNDGRMIDAQKSFEKSLQLEPASIPALAYLATSLIERAQHDEAVKIYKRAIAVEDKNAILHYLLADTLLKIAGSDEKSIENHLARALRLDPKLSSAHLTLGKLRARAENWQSAAAEFELAVRYSPELAEAHYQLGRALARLKRADESRAAMDKFKKLNETQTAVKETARQTLIRRLANVRF